MTKQNKADEQGDALTPGAIATMRNMGWTEAQIEAQRQEAERIRAAGGFSKYVRKAQAARLFSEAVGFHHGPEHMDVTECASRAEWLAAHGAGWDVPASPLWWAEAFATETAERQGWAGMRGLQMLAVAKQNNLRTLEAAADALPLLQWPDGRAWPKGQPLPDKWRSGLFMRKAELRAWAKEHAPDLLGSALLAEATPEAAPAGEPATIAEQGTPAERWKQASPQRKAELAAKAMQMYGTQKKAAQPLGISRQRLATVLRNGKATVASSFPESPWKPHKT